MLEKEEMKKDRERKIAEEKRKKESSRLLQQAITEDLQQEQGGTRYNHTYTKYHHDCI